MKIPKVLFIFGTRPEAIKLCPVIRRFHAGPEPFEVRVCVTGQHRALLDQALEVFSVQPDHDLSVMAPGQTLPGLTSRLLATLEPVFAAESPDVAVVQGDTTTTLAGALAAFYAGVPVAHVEAGLRTGDPREPFPEEMNRLLVSRLTAIHLPATAQAAANLRAEGVPSEAITVTGNTAIDAVLFTRDRLEAGEVFSPPQPWLDPSRRLVLVTAHRRESFGAGFERICHALRRVADLPGVQVAYPVHPNPNVTEPVSRLLGDHPHIHLLDPLDYVAFVDLARRCWLLLTDSGGIQEEAPSLGKPVLVLRDKTERPEAVEAGTSVLVGTDTERIVGEVARLLTDPAEYSRRSRIYNPYGDGQASGRIAAAIWRHAGETAG